MSIWTSRRRILASGLILTLSGCVAGMDGAGFSFAQPAPKSITVARKSVVIAGPQGYCVDKSGTTVNVESAFVLLASCRTINRSQTEGLTARPSILTATVAKTPTPVAASDRSLDNLRAFILTPAGRAAMARDGKAESVTILETLRDKGALLIHLRDTGQGDFQDIEDVYWRGVTDLNGRLVVISVMGFVENPLERPTGLATLRAFLAQIRAETARQASKPKANAQGAPRKGLLQALLK